MPPAAPRSSAETPDVLHLTLRRPSVARGRPPDVVHRWWRYTRPRPSVALALQTRVVGVFGPAYERASLALLRLMAGGAGGDVQGAAAEQAAEVAGMGGDDALALDTFRRAATGHALVDPGEDVATAGARLRAALTYALRHAGARFAPDDLVGAYDEARPAGDVAWLKSGLVHRVLYDSQLEFGGEGKAFDENAASRDPAAEALVSSLTEGPTKFAEALDGVVSGAEELRLVAAAATLHLLRPF